MGSKELLNILESFLGENQLNVLGQYELLSGTKVVGLSPSIMVYYPLKKEAIVRRMKEGSGIECVINSTSSQYHQYHAFGNSAVSSYWEIILKQFHPTKNLADTVNELLKLNTLFFPESPIIRPAFILDNNKGIEPARAVLYACQKHFNRAYL